MSWKDFFSFFKKAQGPCRCVFMKSMQKHVNLNRVHVWVNVSMPTGVMFYACVYYSTDCHHELSQEYIYLNSCHRSK